MKHLSMIFLVAVTVTATAQHKSFGLYYKYNSTSVIIQDSVEIFKGDTLWLGQGAGANKNFIHVSWRPTRASGPVFIPIPPGMANGFLILEEIKTYKALRQEYPDLVFTANGTKVKVSVDLVNAIQTREVRSIGRRGLANR